ncbi:PTS lactose transporter subunit IIC [Erysipelothrix larvae]|uniref:Permease IIC component n=1 Tax=Erysipelothrix larvae TaxID=1514105 RepID=A0A120JTU1_9FIRM|nr:PTS transporter subunit EIIC [Erysipelothrix larvae]AMC93960.1 PTS lactose transporter subunit IIC [Erysipelothrix larvae]
MKKFMDWLTNKFAPAANELFNRPWLAGLSAAMQKVIPFILTGSVIFFYNVFKEYISFLPDLGPILTYSFGLLTLYITFMITNQLMEKLGHPAYTINAGLVAIGTLFMVVMPVGENAGSVDALMGSLGPSGIAVGMIVAIFVAIIFNLWGKLEFLKDSNIPDFLINWINVIIPNLITLGTAMILVVILEINVMEAILSLFMPIANIAQTLPGFILICFIPAFFYSLGVSSWMFGAITTPIYMAGIQANINAVAQGLPATNIVTSESVFTLAFITMGGMGATLGLNLLMLFSKSKELKSMGKVFIAPSIFNINEPIIFGAPVVFNPLLMLPMWINAIVGPVYVWIIMRAGLLNIPTKSNQMGQVPAPISSWMITEDIRAFLWWAILFVIYLAIWYPFFKSYEKIKLADEGK